MVGNPVCEPAGLHRGSAEGGPKLRKHPFEGEENLHIRLGDFAAGVCCGTELEHHARARLLKGTDRMSVVGIDGAHVVLQHSRSV